MPGGFCRIADQPTPARSSMQQRRSRRRCLGAVRRAGCAGHAAAGARQGADPPRSPAPCRAAPPTICSGSAATSSAPRRRCASPRLLAARAAERERRGNVTTRLIERAARWRGRWSTPRPAPGPHRASRCGRSPTTTRRARSWRWRRRRGAAASVIRERLSPDAWRALAELEMALSRTVPADVDRRRPARPPTGAAHHRRLLRPRAGEHEPLAGWRFLDIGRRIERAINTCRFARQFGIDGAPDEELDVLLELADSQITYRMRYVMEAARTPVLDLVVLDPFNPRSVAFQIERIREHWRCCPPAWCAQLDLAARAAAAPPRFRHRHAGRLRPRHARHDPRRDRR